MAGPVRLRARARRTPRRTALRAALVAVGCALAPACGPDETAHALSRDAGDRTERPATAAAAGHEPSPRPPPARHLVLVSVDTLRADRLGCLGYGRDTSPHIDAFAARSLSFTRATAAASATAPSHMSMFTGVPPPVHGVYNLEPGRARDTGHLLPPSIPTLAERLHDAGFATTAFTDGGYLTPDLGFDRGFDTFLPVPQPVDVKIDKVLQWLGQAADRGRRHFLFVHTYEVHAPYVPPREHDLFSDPDYDGPWRHRVDALRAEALGGTRGGPGFLPDAGMATDADRRYLSDLYDGGVHFTDAALGRLLDALARPPWADDTAVILVSDHGEGFAEHGLFAHKTLFEPVTHVPLIVHVPGGPVGRRADRASGVDVAATALGALGLPPPEPGDGVDLLAGPVSIDREVFAFNGTPDHGGESVLRGPWKLLRNRRDRPWRLFDLRADPGETSPLPGDAPAARALLALHARAAQRRQRTIDALGEAVATTTLGDETLDQLSALGYLGDERH